ncbi:uncharacterized protein METZ01_LOCUS48089 [marine metagenome]|uniref:Uncharacterized protein n=1 Tax=marine metagenome TaxID=408172 RepID=A0A381RTM3_9ZZZZ
MALVFILAELKWCTVQMASIKLK